MSESGQNSGAFLDGCFKKLIVSIVVTGLIGVLLLGLVGGALYMKSEKRGVQPEEEGSEHFEFANKNGTDGGVASGKGGGVTGQVQMVRRPVAARERFSFEMVC